MYKNRHGHILDLVISREDPSFVKEVPVTSMLSDHFLVNIEVSVNKSPVSTKTVSYCKYQSIDKDIFLADLKATRLILDLPEDLDQMVDLYNSTLLDLVEKHAPLRTKQMPQRALLPGTTKRYRLQKHIDDVVNACGLELGCLFTTKCLS